MTEPVVHSIGGMWEYAKWEMHENAECMYKGTEYGGPVPCKHCGPIIETVHARADGGTFTNQHFICPRVVVADNEGGCNSTGVCLDCILEAYKT